MVYKIADNITSLLGTTTEQNYQAVKAGRAALREDARLGLPSEGALTRFETLVVRSVRETLKDTTFDVSSDRVVFVLSTTKANVELLGQTDVAPAVLYPGESARRITAYLGFTTMPVVVCNACISGVSALILASRMLEMGMYDYVVVCGADVLNPFVLSGFDALKALSPEDCRPFDIDRNGMNLGEAAATIVLSTEVPDDAAPWVIGAGAVRNDAYHISTPSNKAEGATMALQAVMNYSLGNDVYNFQRSLLEGGSYFLNQTTALLNRWNTEGQQTDIPRVNYTDPMGNARFSDRWIEDGSYLRGTGCLGTVEAEC